MRIVDCEQGSEAWEIHRMVRPTASNFGRIITAKKGDLSTQHRDYACELVARQIGVYTEPPASYWMQWGTDNEPHAVSAYEAKHKAQVERVGFVLPDDTDTYGGSPDGFVDDRKGLLEIKCPKPETMVRYHWDERLPDDYRAQVQGLLLITGCEWCDFVAWHPQVAMFEVRVEPDEEFQAKLVKALEKFTVSLEALREKASKRGIHLVEPTPDPFGE